MQTKIEQILKISSSYVLEKSQKKSILPDSGGQKFFRPDRSSEQAISLQKSRCDFEDYLNEERTVKKSNLSVGEWNNVKEVAIVNTKKGGYWKSFGRKVDGQEMLLPEECLFLIDQGVFELWWDEVPLSVQEAHNLLICKLPSLEYYQVYACLCRLGFTVLRYKRVDSEICSSGSCELNASQVFLDKDSSSPTEELLQLKNGYMGHLWKEEHVKPLVMPENAVSTASVLSRLQIIKTAAPGQATSFQETNSLNCFSLHFDVYQTGALMKKSNPGPPDFRISVCRYDDPAPTPSDIARLHQESNTIPIKFAVAGKGSLSFYGAWPVDLPTLISLG